MISEDVIRVHVDNPEELRTVHTEEIEPGLFTTSSFSLPGSGPVGTPPYGPTQILAEDPLRKRAVIAFNGQGQIALAHSVQQAQYIQNNPGSALQSGEGCIVTCPGSIPVEGTGRLWAVGVPLPQNVQATVGSANISTPTTTFSQLAAVTPTAPGLYNVMVYAYLSGTIGASDLDNIALNVSNTNLFENLLLPAVTGAGVSPFTVQGPFVVNVPVAGDIIAIKTTGLGAPSGTAVYHTQLLVTPIADDVAGSLTVGVLQERRKS